MHPPGVNFINILRTAFALVDPDSVRTQSSCQYLFTLLGTTSVKAVHRMLMKSTPGLGSKDWQPGSYNKSTENESKSDASMK